MSDSSSLYVIRTNKMHAFFINDLIQLYCLRYVSKQPSVHPQEDLHMQFYGAFYVHIDRTAYTDA